MTEFKQYDGHACVCGSTRFFDVDTSSGALMSLETRRPTENLHQCYECGQLYVFKVTEAHGRWPQF